MPSKCPLIALLLILAACGGRLDVQPERAMNSSPVDTTWKEVTPLAEAPRPIQWVPRAATPSRAAPDGKSYPRRFANAAHNSRLGVALPAGRWEVRWKTELNGELFPELLLADSRRILLEGYSEWHLFDMQGELLATNERGPSEVLLDGSHSLIYALDSFGYLAAWSLQEGTLAFQMPIDFGDQFSRPFIARRAQRLFVTGIARKLQPHAPPRNRAFVEAMDLGDPLQVDDTNVLASLRTHARLMRRTRLLLTALQDDALVIATQDRVYQADLDLQLQRAFTGTFTPQTMSLDEAGRIYLTVYMETDAGEERRALWVLSPGGELLVDAELPQAPAIPPIVGYDHRVYLVLEDRVRALNAEGELLWEQHAGEEIVGAIVTADDRLLVAAGQLLAAFDVEGEREVIFYLEKDRWATPPVLTEEGRLYVASERHLYCLQPEE